MTTPRPPSSSRPPKPQLSIVIPCYNEEQRLPPSLGKILGYLALRDIEAEILVVDDGSSDRTAEIAELFAKRGIKTVRLGQNQGKGAATRAGILRSRGDRVLISDADLSTPIEELDRLTPHLASSAVVIGSRAAGGAQITDHQPLYRELMGKTFNKLIRVLGIRGIADTQCGFKLLRGEVARELFSEMITPGFAFDVELLWLARRAGHQIAEVGVTWQNSLDTRVDPLRDPPKMLLEILRFRWAHRRRS